MKLLAACHTRIREATDDELPADMTERNVVGVGNGVKGGGAAGFGRQTRTCGPHYSHAGACGPLPWSEGGIGTGKGCRNSDSDRDGDGDEGQD